MMKLMLKILLIILLTFSQYCFAEYFYILNDKCIEDLYSYANIYFQNTKILPVKNSQGITLRYFFEDPIELYYNYNALIFEQIKDFLANLENPVIIEVHIESPPSREFKGLKRWELSTIIANRIESIIIKSNGKIKKERVNSIGYGEFLPAKNTPNNGGKYLNRIDIIILCNIDGE